ncbi:hypothetical protein L218DRAFT_959896 [Marasmius fiardii PR-910]|nr:hypothetical protein L218DRAFT_959896 [Marasmius fiardii PR-910]
MHMLHGLLGGGDYKGRHASRSTGLTTSHSLTGTPSRKMADNDSKPRSRYRIIKDNWGNRVMFQNSYGLSMDPDDLKEGDRILDELERLEIEAWQERQRAAGR